MKRKTNVWLYFRAPIKTSEIKKIKKKRKRQFCISYVLHRPALHLLTGFRTGSQEMRRTKKKNAQNALEETGDEHDNHGK